MTLPKISLLLVCDMSLFQFRSRLDLSLRRLSAFSASLFRLTLLVRSYLLRAR